jgi:hypothetical protein
MNTTAPSMQSLFDQLGLDSSPEAIAEFIATHHLPDQVRLADAPFWNHSQTAFLQECFRLDAEWMPIVDDLNAQLHHHLKN